MCATTVLVWLSQIDAYLMSAGYTPDSSNAGGPDQAVFMANYEIEQRRVSEKAVSAEAWRNKVFANQMPAPMPDPSVDVYESAG